MATTDPNRLPGPPVAPEQAQGAQIPLDSFTIPEFPAAALRGLRALTLTSGIDVNEYQAQLSRPYKIPALPAGLESLTLELFSLGYPAGFLATLGQRLPNTKSLVVYSQILSGVTQESQDDAVVFLKQLPMLRALHLLDVFAQPNFFDNASRWLKYNASDVPGEARRGLMFLEVNYTYRPEDNGFMSKIQAAELPSLIGPGLISLSFNLSTPESGSEDADEATGAQDATSEDGIVSFSSTISQGLVKALIEEESYPRGLRALNTTLYTFSLEQLIKILQVQKNVMVLNVTLDVEPGEKWKSLLLATLAQCKNLEQIEIVANPGMELIMALQSSGAEVMAKTFPTVADLTTLTTKLSKLASFKASILRSSQFDAINWTLKNSKWVGAHVKGSAISG